MLNRFKETLHRAGINIDQDKATSALLTDVNKKRTEKARAIAEATIFNPDWCRQHNESLVAMATAFGLPEKAQEMARQSMIDYPVQVMVPERTVFTADERSWLDSYRIYIPQRPAFTSFDIAKFPQLGVNAQEASTAMRGYYLELSRTDLDPAAKYPLQLSAYLNEPTPFPLGYPQNETPTPGLVYERHNFLLRGLKVFPDHDDGHMDKRIRDVDLLLTEITKSMRTDVYEDSMASPFRWMNEEKKHQTIEPDDLDDMEDMI